MKWWKVVHWIIIVNFALGIAYSGYMALFVMGDGSGLPLFAKAKAMQPELLIIRRLYAIECWVAITGLAIYLAITEIAPRRKE